MARNEDLLAVFRRNCERRNGHRFEAPGDDNPCNIGTTCEAFSHVDVDGEGFYRLDEVVGYGEAVPHGYERGPDREMTINDDAERDRLTALQVTPVAPMENPAAIGDVADHRSATVLNRSELLELQLDFNRPEQALEGKVNANAQGINQFKT